MFIGMETDAVENIALETVKEDVVSNGIDEVDASTTQKYTASVRYTYT